jgi:hypothetical protein
MEELKCSNVDHRVRWALNRIVFRFDRAKVTPVPHSQLLGVQSLGSAARHRLPSKLSLRPNQVLAALPLRPLLSANRAPATRPS